MAQLAEGDTVTIYWTKRRPWKDATLLHTPSGPGDLWQVRHANGEVVAINPYSPEFVGMFRKEKDELR